MRTPRYLLWGREFHTWWHNVLGHGTHGWCNVVDRETLWGLWHLLRCYRAYDVSTVESIMAHQQRWIPSGYSVLVLPWHNSYHSWVPLSKDKETGPTSGGLPLSVSHSTPSCSLRWAVLPSTPGWLLCTVSLVDTFFSSALGWLDSSTPPLSYLRSKFQLVGVSGEGWASVVIVASLQFVNGFSNVLAINRFSLSQTQRFDKFRFYLSLN